MLIFKDLYDFTKKFATWRRNYPDVDGKLIDIIPNRLARTIVFRFRVQSVSKKNEGYNTWLLFTNIEFSDTPTSSNCAKIIDKETKKPLFFEKISLTGAKQKNYVRVRCSCFDFRFRFAWEDKAVGALYGGRPASYKRKPGSNRPEVNPEHIPGMCKHIWQCCKSLERYFIR